MTAMDKVCILLASLVVQHMEWLDISPFTVSALLVFSNVLKGLDWVIGQNSSNIGQKLIVSLSLGGSCLNSINMAVERVMKTGIAVNHLT